MITTLLLSKLNSGLRRAVFLKGLCLLLLNLAFGLTVFGQTNAVIPTGNAGGPTSDAFLSQYPFGNTFPFQQSTAIYLNTEIQAAAAADPTNPIPNFTTGTITHLSFYVESLTSPQPVNVVIRLKQTAATSYPRDPNDPTFSTVLYRNEDDNSTVVYSNPNFSVTSTGWVTIDITDFPINTTSATPNLEVLVETQCIVCANGAGDEPNVNAKQFRFHDSGTDRFLFFSDSAPIASSNRPGEITTFQPNIQLTLTSSATPPPTCNPVTINSVTAGQQALTFNYNQVSPGTNTITLTASGAPTVTTTLGASPATVSGLQDNTTYNYSIVTNCTAGGTSTATTGTAPATNPPVQTCQAPTGVSVTSSSPNTITVSYTASGGLTGDYFINYNGSPIQLTSNPQTITNVPAGTYNYSVYKQCGTTQVVGGSGQVTVNDPVAPTCNAVTVNSITPGQNSLTFNYTQGSAGTNTITLTASGAPTITTTLGASPATISGLQDNTTYSYSIVTNCTAGGTSTATTGTAPATNPPVQVCEAPTNVSVTSSSPNTITASFTASGGLSGNYFLEYGSTTVQLTSNPQTITSVPAGTYNFTIYKLCGATRVNGTPTGSVTVNDPVTPTCNAVTVNSVTPGQNSLTFNYTQGSAGTNTITLTASGAPTVTTTLGASPATVSGLQDNITYNYSIVTNCTAGGTSTATTGTAPATNPPVQVCQAPTGVSVTSPAANSIQVSFTASSGLAGNYFITYNGTTVQLTTSPQTINNVPAGTYSYSVYKDCNGTQAVGASGQITVSDPTAQPCNPPTAATVASNNFNEITVSYTASNTGATGNYFINYTPTGGGTTTTVALSSNPQTLTSVPAGSYNYVVYKDCSGTQSAGNPTGTVTVQNPPAPTCQAPTGVSVNSPTANTIQVSFTQSSGLTGNYFITYNGTTVQLTTSPQTISNVPAGTYTYSVYKDCNGTQAVGGSGQVTVNNPTPQPCNPVTVNSVTPGQNSLTFNYTTGSAGTHTITLTASGAPTVTTTLAASPATVSGLQSNTTYNYSIVTDCGGGSSSSATTGSATTTSAPVACVTGTWLGTTSSDWHTAANWCNGVIPDGATNVIIPENTGSNPVPNYPVITANALANNLIIQPNATLTLTSGLLTINGLYTNSGTLIDNGNGSLAFTSIVPQTLGKPGNVITFLDLTTGPGGIIMAGPINIRRMLVLNGNLTTAGNDLNLLADNAIQSMVVNNGTAQVIGTATMEKYINPGINPSFGYRQLTSPVANATINQLNDDTPLVVNPAYNTNPTPNTTTPFPTIYRYNEARLDLPFLTSPNFDSGWESPNDLNEVMQPAVGYTVNMLPVKIDFTGTLNNGNYSRTLTRGSKPRSGYNLIGNPYPAPLNWDLVNLPAGVDQAAYVVRSTGRYTGTYVAYVNSIPANGEYIAAMQGFFVRATVPSTTITFENNDRVTTYENPALYRKVETRPVITLALRDATGIEDKTYVYFENGATVNFDGQYDAFKLPNGGPIPSIFSLAGNDQLAINGLPVSATNTIVPLGGRVPQAGTWTFSADQIINFQPNQTIYLEDIATNTMHNLSQQNSYTFSTTQTDLSGRFFLRFGPGATSGITAVELASKVTVYPNPTNGTFTISMPALNAKVVEAALFNAIGQKVWQQGLETDGVYLKETVSPKNLAPGVYTLRLETNAGPVQRKIIIE